MFFSESDDNNPLTAQMIPLPHQVWLMVHHYPVATIKIYGMGSASLRWAMGLSHIIMVVLVRDMNVMSLRGMMLVRHCPFLCLSYVKLCCQ